MELHIIIDNLPSQKMPRRCGMDLSSAAPDGTGRGKIAAGKPVAAAGKPVAGEPAAATGKPVAGEPALHNEHGLCLHFALDGKNYLVDTGASGKALENMDTLHCLGIAVPQGEDIDAVFISHGHNDHTGGLRKFIERNPAAPIYLHNSIRGNYFFSCRPKNGVQEARSIGMEQALFAEHQERFREIEGVTRITDKITLIPITWAKGYAAPMGNEFLFKNDFPDNFTHETAILVEHSPGEFTVISPCTHNGILNVLECCTRYLSAPNCAGDEKWCQNGHFSAPSCARDEKWCQNGHFSAPSCAGDEKWCQNGHFSAPNDAGDEKWCQNRHFSAPNDAGDEKWCQNGHFFAPNDAGDEKWCQNGHFSSPSCAGDEKWCQNGHFSAPSCAEDEKWCQNGHFSAPNNAGSKVWCQNRHFSAPNDAGDEKWCQNGHFFAPSCGNDGSADKATGAADGATGAEAGETLSGRERIRYFVGGLHYVDYLQRCGENKEAAQIIGTANKLKELYPGLKVFSGHCTCSAAGELLESVLGDNYGTFCTGRTILCK